MILSRRQILASAGAMAVLGFNTSARAWVGNGPAASAEAFRRLPPLDGVVLTDPASLAPYAKDAGNTVHETPVAVLFPESVDDIQKMVRFCQRHEIKVAARGQGHTTFGQSQVGGGLVIDMASINQVHAITRRAANVGAGLKWSDLVPQTFARGLRPPVLTGYLGLSIAGTLSVGGISMANGVGAQVDHARELDVVTGEGELLTCSATRNRELFEVALAGLGQCGIITRAVVDLVPALAMTRVYTITYTDLAAFFLDLRDLLDRGELDALYGQGGSDGAGGWVFQLIGGKHFDPANPPDDSGFFSGLSVAPSEVAAMSIPYLDFALQVDFIIDSLRQAGLWDDVLHPWFDVFLPDRTVEPYVTQVMSNLTPEDVGPTGFLLLFPLERASLRRPMLRVPNGDDRVYLFDILTAAAAPGPDPAFERRMLERNRRLFEKARRAGGTRYPIGSLPFSHADWVLHYGEQWLRLVRAKQRFDPARILTPGPGIFS